MIGATLKSWHSRAMRVVIEGVGGPGEVEARLRGLLAGRVGARELASILSGGLATNVEIKNR